MVNYYFECDLSVPLRKFFIHAKCMIWDFSMTNVGTARKITEKAFVENG